MIYLINKYNSLFQLYHIFNFKDNTNIKKNNEIQENNPLIHEVWISIQKS